MIAGSVGPRLRGATVGGEPKVSHKNLAIAAPMGWALMNEGCPPRPSSIGRYVFPFCRDLELFPSRETEARKHCRRQQVEGLEEVTG
jgi:hypothetical protein